MRVTIEDAISDLQKMQNTKGEVLAMARKQTAGEFVIDILERQYESYQLAIDALREKAEREGVNHG